MTGVIESIDVEMIYCGIRLSRVTHEQREGRAVRVPLVHRWGKKWDTRARFHK